MWQWGASRNQWSYHRPPASTRTPKIEGRTPTFQISGETVNKPHSRTHWRTYERTHWLATNKLTASAIPQIGKRRSSKICVDMVLMNLFFFLFIFSVSMIPIGYTNCHWLLRDAAVSNKLRAAMQSLQYQLASDVRAPNN